jgi:hypothetical protein
MEAIALINRIWPEHDRTNCEDNDPCNGFFSKNEKDPPGLCTRCMMLEIIAGETIDGRPLPDIIHPAMFLDPDRKAPAISGSKKEAPIKPVTEAPKIPSAVPTQPENPAGKRRGRKPGIKTDLLQSDLFQLEDLSQPNDPSESTSSNTSLLNTPAPAKTAEPTNPAPKSKPEKPIKTAPVNFGNAGTDSDDDSDNDDFEDDQFPEELTEEQILMREMRNESGFSGKFKSNMTCCNDNVLIHPKDEPAPITRLEYIRRLAGGAPHHDRTPSITKPRRPKDVLDDDTIPEANKAPKNKAPESKAMEAHPSAIIPTRSAPSKAPITPQTNGATEEANSTLPNPTTQVPEVPEERLFYKGTIKALAEKLHTTEALATGFVKGFQMLKASCICGCTEKPVTGKPPRIYAVYTPAEVQLSGTIQEIAQTLQIPSTSASGLIRCLQIAYPENIKVVKPQESKGGRVTTLYQIAFDHKNKELSNA